MFLNQGTQVPCVNLPADVDLGDIQPWATPLDIAVELVAEGRTSALLYFVENSIELQLASVKLKQLWDRQITFWLFYPKNKHLSTDLTSDLTWKIMRQSGAYGTRQVGIDENWSCMYFKNTGKSDYVELIPGEV
jgi:hypothetical protein